VKFVDNDLSKSTVVGDYAIILYVEAVYGLQSKTLAKSRVDLARQFTRLQQCEELLRKWRATPFRVKPFRHELELWEVLAGEADYIAGSTISLADYAFWPILEDIRNEWRDKIGYDNLVRYYHRIKDRDSIVKALGFASKEAWLAAYELGHGQREASTLRSQQLATNIENDDESEA